AAALPKSCLEARLFIRQSARVPPLGGDCCWTPGLSSLAQSLSAQLDRSTAAAVSLSKDAKCRADRSSVLPRGGACSGATRASFVLCPWSAEPMTDQAFMSATAAALFWRRTQRCCRFSNPDREPTSFISIPSRISRAVLWLLAPSSPPAAPFCISP